MINALFSTACFRVSVNGAFLEQKISRLKWSRYGAGALEVYAQGTVA
jgi:hypothetical protein